jgi:peptidyl-dipeptidase Dcp
MLSARNWRWGSGLAVQLLTARAFHTNSHFATQAAYRPPAFFFRAAKSFHRASAALFVSTAATDEVSSTSTNAGNPLLRSWSDQPFHLPPFKSITPEHFEPALIAAMEAHIADLEAIASSSSNSFDSILGAYDRAGSLYSKVASVYGNYISSLNTPDMQTVQTKMAPILSRHRSKCYNIPGLFAKVEQMHAMKDEMLEKGEWNAEQARLAERVYIGFVRMGAKLSEEDKKEYADIQAEQATLQTSFMQNILKDEEEWEMVITSKDMEGCPPDLVSNARQAAIDRKHDGSDAHVITLGRSLVEPFLTYSARRDLRKKAFEAWTSRGELSQERDNLSIAVKILRLRRRQAELMGTKTFAEYQTQDTMAQTPENVNKLLSDVWARAKEAANRERQMLETFVSDTGETLDGGIRPWDWRYYAEKVRQAEYNFDESELKPYLSLDAVTNAMFDVSNKLYGLKYVKRDDVEAYHPDVNVYEVRRNKIGSDEYDLVAIFLHDNYARAHKSSGAWMSEYRSQKKNLVDGADIIEAVPIVSNNNNFAKGSGATLLSFDDGITLFHEAGHGHHGMLSDATYRTLASTSVLRDFVELPSQLMEHWLSEPVVLKQHAKHYQTGEPVPEDLLTRLKAASLFNEGFAVVEYTSCALYDMAVHSLSEYGDDFDLAKFEKEYLEEIGMPQGIVMRHRPGMFFFDALFISFPHQVPDPIRLPSTLCTSLCQFRICGWLLCLSMGSSPRQ